MLIVAFTGLVFEACGFGDVANILTLSSGRGSGFGVLLLGKNVTFDTGGVTTFGVIVDVDIIGGHRGIGEIVGMTLIGFFVGVSIRSWNTGSGARGSLSSSSKNMRGIFGKVFGKVFGVILCTLFRALMAR